MSKSTKLTTAANISLYEIGQQPCKSRFEVSDIEGVIRRSTFIKHKGVTAR